MKQSTLPTTAKIATHAAILGVMICLAVGMAARAAAPAQQAMTLISSAFKNHAVLPEQFTADGKDISPPLTWRHVPRKAVSLVVVMIDPDAPGPLAFRHWMIVNIPPTAKGLPENVSHAKRIVGLPSAQQGINSFGKRGYGGPAPPPGPAHHYRIILYALSRKLLFAPDCLPCLQHAMAGCILAWATLHVHYGRIVGK